MRGLLPSKQAFGKHILLAFTLLFLAVLFLTRTSERQRETKEEADVDDLKFLIQRFNSHGSVRHANRFHLAPDHIPIVVYVYQRPQYLQQVLRHLRGVTGINETLLIISHDGLVPRMLETVEKEVDFCQVKTIVHPVSSHRPCTEEACAIFRVKEHWWWLQEQVWDSAEIRAITQSPWRIFLEEDHCVTHDSYQYVKEMRRLCDRSLGLPKGSRSTCWGVGLSPMMDRTPPLREEPWNLVDYHWGVQNNGYAFSARTWRLTQQSAEEFHAFHDGWDVAVLHLMQVNLLPALVLLPRLARLRNVGVVGATQVDKWYEEAGFARAAVSAQHGAALEDFLIGTRVLGKDPALLPYMGPYGHKYDFDAMKPGVLNNNWDGHYGGDITSHWGVRGDWQPGSVRPDGWPTLFASCLCVFLVVSGSALALLLNMNARRVNPN